MKPMLCKKITLEQAEKLPQDEWVIEPKLDGIRAYVEDGVLRDRRGKDIMAKFPEVAERIHCGHPNLDGEIIAQSGIFEDVSGRVHMNDAFKIKLAAKMNPAKYVVFDVVNPTLTLPERQKLLLNGNVPFETIKQWTLNELNEQWNGVLNRGEEGLILKRINSYYEFGKRSRNWLKLKAFTEVIAEFTKYEEHSHGVTIETVDGRRVVVNGAQAEKVRQAFHQGPVVKAEIQFLPQINSDAWRFPSFRGLV